MATDSEPSRKEFLANCFCIKIINIFPHSHFVRGKYERFSHWDSSRQYLVFLVLLNTPRSGSVVKTSAASWVSRPGAVNMH